jgi:sugar lactone lactonase YvrE
MVRRLRAMLLAAGTAMLVASIAQAAPIGTLKQFRIPTANGNPSDITQGSDGNFWFTESHVNPPQSDNHHVGRITPSGDITEFLVCQFCFPSDIAQGSNGILYFTKSDPGLGRITTSGSVLPDVVPPNTLANGNGVAASGDDVYFTAFNTNSIWRYNAAADAFTEFQVPTAGAIPYDITVAPDGSVWFTEFGADQLGRLNPATGAITETPVGNGPNGPRGITVATDGKVWFTKRFDNSVGYLAPSSGAVVEFPLAPGGGPEGIAAAPDGAVWFTQSVAGNVARITAAGVTTEGKRVKGSEPFGVTVAPNGDPWYAELSADKIAVLQLR